MSSPLVSVVMPCFNAVRYVNAAVESVLRQTWGELELVVVDDGSTDGSREVLSAINDPRFRLVTHFVSKGASCSRNRGYLETHGSLIKFFDSDDLMEPDFIARQVNRLAGRTDAIAIGEWKRFYGCVPESGPFSQLPMYRDATPVEWLRQEWATGRPMMQPGLWLIPRPIIELRGLWDERLTLIDDFEFYARVLLGATEILYTPGARMHYRSGLAGSLSGTKNRKAAESAFLSVMLGTEHLLSFSSDVGVRTACAAILQDFDFTYYPEHPDLRARVSARVVELGGSTLEPDGPPTFHKLRRFIGWRLARRMQRFAEANRLNHAGWMARGKAPGNVQ
jgi:glycosyltransferase involved in cell wall biosynthesis